MTKDTGSDMQKCEAPVAQAKQWKDEWTLPFPDYPPEKIAEIRDTLEYPPSKSALRREK